MVTRPSYIYGGTTDNWVLMGQEAIQSPVYYQSTEPVGAPTGSIWVNSGLDVPVSYASTYRWQYTATGGETTLSGAGLVYTAGYEQVYLNGVLLVRGQDYQATTGTTITNLSALAVGDSVEILNIGTYALTDMYTKAQSDARFVNKNVGGLNLVVPTSVTGGTVSTNGQVTVGSAVSSVVVNGVFSATYDGYKIVMTGGVGSTSIELGFGLNGISTGHYSNLIYGNYASNATLAAVNGGATSYFRYCGMADTSNTQLDVEIWNPYLTKKKWGKGTYNPMASSGNVGTANLFVDSTTSSSGFTITCPSGTITGGTIRIYGYNNGV